jgi:ribosome-associated heat shock protein Hsp15
MLTNSFSSEFDPWRCLAPTVASFRLSLKLPRVQTPATVRIDKWLWAVRLYPTRSLATVACNAGQVKVGGQRVKPSRNVHPGDLVTAFSGGVHRTVRVLALLHQRVGAKRVGQFLEDLTSPEAYARAREEAPIQFPKGFGRPTKRDRRQLERLC